MKPTLVTLDVIEAALGADAQEEMQSVDAVFESKGALGVDQVSYDANHMTDPVEYVSRIEQIHGMPIAAMLGMQYRTQ